MMGPKWKLAVDVGGTFTDAVAIAPNGQRLATKVLSMSAVRMNANLRDSNSLALSSRAVRPSRGFIGMDVVLPGASRGSTLARIVAFDVGTSIATLDRAWTGAANAVVDLVADEEAPTLAARLITETPVGERVPSLELRLATTRGTNALLERTGARTAWFVTKGFADLLHIGDQTRPDLFARDIAPRRPLASHVVEVTGRLASNGDEIAIHDRDALAADARRAVAAGYVDAALTLVHGWRRPDLEGELAGVLRNAGFLRVTTGAASAPFPGLLARAETTVLDAWLGPVLASYLDRVRSSLNGADVLVMTSAGTLVRREVFSPKQGLLSGPAGGVAGALEAGRRSGISQLITFDMGGTSTDTARLAGSPDLDSTHSVGGVRLAAPAVAVESVAAGGGSICRVDRGIPVVGPESAGSKPGPACYGAGGPLTITDCNLLLGRIPEDRFGIAVNRAAAEARVAELLTALGSPVGREELLEGFLAIADERMAEAVREVSVRRGYDPKDHALVAFGGAGGLHACAVASRLGIERVLVPQNQGLLSAVGALSATRSCVVREAVVAPLDECAPKLEAVFERLERTALNELDAAGDVEITFERTAEMRQLGQESTLDVRCEHGGLLAAEFSARHVAAFGMHPGERGLEVVAVRLRAAVAAVKEDAQSLSRNPRSVVPAAISDVFMNGVSHATPVFERAALDIGAALNGPALIVESHGTTLVAAGWRVTVDSAHALCVTRLASDVVVRRASSIELELYTHRFRSIAYEMGEVLRRASVSTNIKERLDFSCAVLDAEGRLVVNAPHIPVHLGAMGLCARSLLENEEVRPGDSFVVNHPAFGGSHLPDVTVMTPVFTRDGTLIAWVGSRAHHAELGGIVPGSMPPAARSLSEEGVAIAPLRISIGGKTDLSAVSQCLSGAPYPTRALKDNLSDILAAESANRRGSARLLELAEVYGVGPVSGAMNDLRRRAEVVVTEALRVLGTAPRGATSYLDDGTRIQVSISFDGARPVIDFAGTSGVHTGSLNATPAVTRACVLYALRLLVDEPLPLNEGFLEAIDLRVPEGLLNPRFDADPRLCPGVVAGNVETSQRVVDTLLAALGTGAMSQGTMNNVTFGHAHGSHYETVGGGAGATARANGASGVQVHMTNTRITDPEVLESRHAVRIESFEFRRGSGGAGRHRGGDGLRRSYRFLVPMTVSLLAQRRASGPDGASGGEAGAPGTQHVMRADGTLVKVDAMSTFVVGAGDVLVVETPGGGGFGAPLGSG